MLFLRICFVCLFFPLLLSGQTTTAILGNITDRSGAVVPGATVRILHEGTQTSHTVVSNERGSYFLPLSQVGLYTVSVELTRFKTARQTGIPVEINQRVRVDVTLQIGDVRETVTVEGAAPAVATDEASLGEVFTQRSINELPLNGRNVLQLATLSSNVTLTSGFAGSEAVVGAGVRQNMNSLSLDGVSIVNNLINTATMRPSLDALEEFKVQHGNYTAEYGNYMGAHVDLVTKAGTNDFHGSVFEFIRNDILDARNFFEDPKSPKNPLRRNEFGFVLSGPVYIPKVYNGKNRTFFMGNYEGLRYIRKSSQLATLMTPLMRQGNFSEISTAIKDPLNKNTPFQNNIIPPDRIAAQTKKILEWIPQPNLPGLMSNYLATTFNRNTADKFFLRLDHMFSEKAHVYVRYGWQDYDSWRVAANPFAERGDAIPDRNLMVGYTHIISPSTLNEFRVGRHASRIYSLNHFQDNTAGLALGIKGMESGLPGIPRFRITGYMGAGEDDQNTPWYHRDQTWQVYDGVSITRGEHSFKVGFETRFLMTTRASANWPRGDLQFTGEMTGNAAADFMLGLPRAGTTPAILNWAYIRQWRHAAYFLDDWKVTSRLTLNLGVRYELNRVPYDVDGALPILDPANPNKTIMGKDVHFTLGDHNNFAPRIGFAWRPFSNKTVLRGGFGVYYNGNQTNNYTIFQNNPPLPSVQTFTSLTAKPTMFIADPFSATANVPPPPNIQAIQYDLRSPYMQQWSFNVQRELWRNFGLELGYIGSHTVKLDRNFFFNNPRPGPGNIQARRPNQTWGTIRLVSNDSSANYNGLQIAARQRLTRGTNFLVSYTWAHAIDMAADINTTTTGNMNPYNLSLERGNANWDIRHRLVASYVVELPFFKNSGPRFARQTLGGWQINGIANLQSGTPFTILSGRDITNTGDSNQRADRVRDGTLSRSERSLTRYFDIGAFTLPALYTFGNAGRNVLIGPGTVNFDMSFFKVFNIGDRVRVQFRFEAFNILNTPSFSNPNGTLGGSSFGQIGSTKADPRDLQFGLRVQF